MTSMIGRLVRTELESYLRDVVVWGGTVFFLFFVLLSFMGPVVVLAKSGGSHLGYAFGLFLLSVALSSVLLAFKVSGQNALEKRTRLFSQLPVSVREVSFASWCVRSLCLWIPTLACTVLVARVTSMEFTTFALITLATYLGGTTLVAASSVAMSIRHLPSRMAAWVKGLYAASAIVAVVIWFLGNMLVFPRFPFSAIGRLTRGDLTVLTGFLLLSGIGLVVLDIWLRDRLEDYLG